MKTIGSLLAVMVISLVSVNAAALMKLLPNGECPQGTHYSQGGCEDDFGGSAQSATAGDTGDTSGSVAGGLSGTESAAEEVGTYVDCCYTVCFCGGGTRVESEHVCSVLPPSECRRKTGNHSYACEDCHNRARDAAKNKQKGGGAAVERPGERSVQSPAVRAIEPAQGPAGVRPMQIQRPKIVQPATPATKR